MATERRVGTFYINDLWFGVEVGRVQEVIHLPAITPVPLAPITIAGLVNLRGQILTVIDLRKRLGLERTAAVKLPAVILVRWENSLVGLLVDQIGDVAAAPEDSFEAVPGSLPERVRKMVPEVCKLPARLLHLLDLDEILGHQERGPFCGAMKQSPGLADGR